mgnify:CR=1 FL=1
MARGTRGKTEGAAEAAAGSGRVEAARDVIRIEREGLDGAVLAAAGVKRLGISYPHTIELPVEQFLPAPAQGLRHGWTGCAPEPRLPRS